MSSLSSSSSQHPQQPGLVYPNTVTGQPAAASSSSSHSKGSFGTVFVVLAVIVVISAIACCLGRLCNRRHRSHKEKPSKQIRPNEKAGRSRDLEFEPPERNRHNFRPGERENTPLEFGFDKNIAASKPAGNGESRGFKQFGNGDIRFEPQFADFGEPKTGA